MGNITFTANSSVPSSFFMKARRNKLWSKKKEKWKSINFITIEENFSFKVSDSSSIKLTEQEDKIITPKKLPRYGYNTPEKEIQSAEHPGHLPVVLTAPAPLQRLDYKEEHLPLGIVLNVLFQHDNWLYVRTAHGHEGYVCSDICLPLEIPCHPRQTSSYHMNTLETLKLIYEEDVHGEINYSERNVDLLYLQATGIRQKQCLSSIEQKNDFRKSTILIVKNDYESHETNTLSVKKGEVVFLVHCRVRGWFWVRNEQHEEGFIPAVVAGYRCF